jgi:hypothetical protein
VALALLALAKSAASSSVAVSSTGRAGCSMTVSAFIGFALRKCRYGYLQLYSEMYRHRNVKTYSRHDPGGVAEWTQ